ncbi:MAG: hypothetical protein HUJ68_08790 [Clostridia bacterium]|nr:hypothetical protein [Clostridia bacterium]
MKYLIGLFFTLVRILISGIMGSVAWNISIPIIFKGAPSISLLQSIIISIVVEIMCYGGSIPEDKTNTGDYAATTIVKTVTLLFVSGLSLLTLWIIMKVAY